MKELEKIQDKISELEKERIGYLEADDNVSANRIQRKIINLTEKLDLYELNNLKTKLKIYKSVIKDYPYIKLQISEKLKENGLYE